LVGILLKKKCCNEQRNNSIKIGCKINNPHIKKKEKKENTLFGNFRVSYLETGKEPPIQFQLFFGAKANKLYSNF